MSAGFIRIEIGRVLDLDPVYLGVLFFARHLTWEIVDDALICQAFTDSGEQIGILIAHNGTGIRVQVKPEHRRQGIATRMIRELERAGHPIAPDWDNLTPDGAALAQAIWGRGAATLTANAA